MKNQIHLESARRRRKRILPYAAEQREGKRESSWAGLNRFLAAPVSGASLGVFRIALGTVMFLEALALFQPNPSALGSLKSPLETYYTGADIKFHLPFPAFEWVPLLSAHWIYVLVAMQAVASILMAAGIWYRAATAAVFLSWGYLWVVESTRTYWQSHYYLEVLLLFLMLWMPADRRYSVKSWSARQSPSVSTVPSWTVFLLRAQLVIAYFYAGVAKLNVDWLLDAMPVRWFIAQPHVMAPYAKYLSPGQLAFANGILHSSQCAYFLSYSGLLFDLFVGFLLLIRRTRIFAMVLMVLFHAMNHFFIFDDIGWFPLVGILTATIFLDPDWPERLWRWLRQPRLSSPDWAWFWGGILLFPAVGSALGWKLKRSEGSPQVAETYPLARRVVPLCGLWLACQAFMPIRHYLIPANCRFTYEHLSFSWRLKSEVRRSAAANFFVEDPAILWREPTGRWTVNWGQWQGDRAIHRRVTGGAINWARLPEIVVLLEPMVGQRVVYNPFHAGVRTESEARDRLSRCWNELYGRDLKLATRTITVADMLLSLAGELRAHSLQGQASKVSDLALRFQQLERNQLDLQMAEKTKSELPQLIQDLHGHSEARSILLSALQKLDPFVLEGERSSGAPFLIIDDPAICRNSEAGPSRVDLSAWKHGACTRNDGHSGTSFSGGEPLVIYTGSLGPDASRDLLPQVCIFDSQDRPQQPPFIWWNTAKDLTLSKLLHVSNQPFYLRRYTRRIATLWEQQYSRRPVVRAATAVSLNGRPQQLLVDPTVDLASTRINWFGHNYWIKDLETPRIPADALKRVPVL